MAKKKKTKKALIVGGSSGLGAQLAKLLQREYNVTVTGTTTQTERGKKPKPRRHCQYVQLEVTSDMRACMAVLRELAKTKWDIIIWSAGFEWEHSIDTHTLEDIELLTNVGFKAPAQFVSNFLIRHANLGQLVLISGVTCDDVCASQPIMWPVRKALEAFAECMWHDERVASVVNVAPDRMKGTRYYTGTERDTSDFADVKKVAERIFVFMKDRTKFRELYFKGEVPHVHRQDYSGSLLPAGTFS